MSLVPFDDRDGVIWLDGRFVPWREAKVHVLTHGLHYASSVFEGERMYSGRIYKLDLDGKVLGWLGKFGHEPGQFQWIHELHCTSENELLVGEIQNWRMQKLTLRPAPRTPTTASR